MTTFLVWSLLGKSQKFKVAEILKKYTFVEEKTSQFNGYGFQKVFHGKNCRPKMFLYKIYLTIFLSEVDLEKLQKIEVIGILKFFYFSIEKSS